MNYRIWCYERLTTDVQLASVVPPTSVFGAGAVGAVPSAKPFIVLRFGPRTASIGSIGNLTVWAHDEPGDYELIDEILGHARRLLDGAVPGVPGMITSEWTSDSTDLADDGYGTITKNSSYRLIESS
jgi:hypothetical protein